MSFKNEIEAIVGDIDSPDYTSQVALYLAEGVKFITKYVMNLIVGKNGLAKTLIPKIK